MQEAIATQFMRTNGNDAHCALPLGSAAMNAWRADQVRGCLRNVVGLLNDPTTGYMQSFGSNASAAIQLLMSCVESTPREMGDWLAGAVSKNTFSRHDLTYGAEFSVDFMDSTGRAILGLQHGAISPGQSYLGASHAFLVTHDMFYILDDGVQQNMTFTRWQSVLGTRMDVRVNYDDYAEFLVDGQLLYTSKNKVVYPLHAVAALFNSKVDLHHVHWLDRRDTEFAPPLQADMSLTNMTLSAGNADMNWEDLPGVLDAGAERDMQPLSEEEKAEFQDLWDAQVATHTALTSSTL
jgi:hypothetical protein